MRWILALLFSSSMAFAGEPLEILPAQIMPKAKDGLITATTLGCGTLYFVGERGHLFKWDEEKRELEQLKFPTRTLFTNFSAQKEKLWAVGHDALIAYVLECGEVWIIKHHDFDLQTPLFWIQFHNDDIGLAVGAYGLALITQDGGQTWTRIYPSEEEPHFYQGRVGPNMKWYLAGEFGTVLKLNSDGEVDVKYDTGTETTFFGIEVLGEDQWIAYGLKGLMVLYDGTTTTVLNNPRKSSLYNSWKIRGVPIFVGEDGTVLLYRDGKLVDRSIDERIPIISLEATASGDTLVIGTSKGVRALDVEELLK